MRAFVALVVMLHCSFSYAQNQDLDTVYLKDNSFYIGFVTQIAVSDTVSILSPIGSTYAIPFSDVKRIHISKPKNTRRKFPVRIALVDTLKIVQRYRGFLFQTMISTQFSALAANFTFGYKFNRNFHLGILMGFETTLTPTTYLNRVPNEAKSENSTTYWPLALHIGGDLSPKQFTPYYQIRIGAAFNVSPKTSDDYNGSALDIGVAFGFKAYSLSRKYFTFGISSSIKQYSIQYSYYEKNQPTKWQNTPATALFFGMYVGFGI
jgi:opacity protein-like surface antigen